MIAPECSPLAVPIPALIPVGGHRLPGQLCLPVRRKGIVLLAHGSGSSYQSAENRFLAQMLNKKGQGTLALDLLDEDEAQNRRNVFDIDLQAGRLMEVTRWLRSREDTAGLPLGYYGSGVGSGVVLLAAAQEPAQVAAVVSGGGRVDMVQHWLPRIQAATLLVVGERHGPLVEWHDKAYACLGMDDKKLILVPKVTNLLEEEPGLDALSRHACDWFGRHLGSQASQGGAARH